MMAATTGSNKNDDAQSCRSKLLRACVGYDVYSKRKVQANSVLNERASV